MSEKFIIDREQLKSLIKQYQGESRKTDELTEYYIENILKLLGTDVLEIAINKASLKVCITNMLNNKKIHNFYSDEDFFLMIEGLSNYEIVGDWQHFLTINSEYIFRLPPKTQEKFADNFSIGNKEAKECLLTLWKNGIETTSTNIVRKGEPDSKYTITISCQPDNIRPMIEVLRQKFTCKKYVSCTT